MSQFNLTFKTSVNKLPEDFAEIHSLKSVCSALGVHSVKLADKGNGKFLILIADDGLYTTIPASKEMQPHHLSTARVALMKKPNEDGTPAYVAIRPEGESSVVLGGCTF